LAEVAVVRRHAEIWSLPSDASWRCWWVPLPHATPVAGAAATPEVSQRRRTGLPSSALSIHWSYRLRSPRTGKLRNAAVRAHRGPSAVGSAAGLLDRQEAVAALVAAVRAGNRRDHLGTLAVAEPLPRQPAILVHRRGRVCRLDNEPG